MRKHNVFPIEGKEAFWRAVSPATLSKERAAVRIVNAILQ